MVFIKKQKRNMNEMPVPIPKICVIIVSYNFEPWIPLCLPSVKASTLPATVVVIDNASQDRTREIIRSQYPDIVLMENNRNLGFGKANNQGMKYALDNGFDYVFLLNQDARLHPRALERLILAASHNTDYGILSPIHLNGKGDRLDFGFAEYTRLTSKEEIEQLPHEVTECTFINAAMWLVPTSVIKKIGGFAPIFPHYGEDRNYAQRVRKNGYRVGFVKSAIGYHHRQQRKISPNEYFYSEYIYFLTEAVNPYYSCFKAFAYSVLAAAKKAFISLFKGEISSFSKYITIASRLIAKTPAIYRTRKETTTPGTHYLQ